MATNLEFIKSASGTSVSSLSVTDCFSADYDVYQIHINKMEVSVEEQFRLRFIDSGGVITTTSYDWAYADLRADATFPQQKATSQSQIRLHNSGSTNSAYIGGFVYNIFNPFDNSSYTFTQGQSSARAGTALRGSKNIGVLKSATSCTGVNFSNMGGTLSLTVNVYGVK